jgi:hypothetical protein
MFVSLFHLLGLPAVTPKRGFQRQIRQIGLSEGEPRLVDPQKDVSDNRDSDIKPKGAHERAMDFLCFLVGKIRPHVGAITIGHCSISIYLHWSEDGIVLDGIRA